MQRFWDFIDGRAIIRRLMLFSTMYMTWHAYLWAAHFAENTARTGMEVPGIIAAVTTPIITLMGYVLKVYSDGRNA